MTESLASKSFTVRMPLTNYEAVLAVARRRRKSVNSIVQESLAAMVHEEEQRALAAWFDELGADADESSVEYAFAAQSEVVLRDRE